jgi:type II secretory pathway component PulK
MSSEKSRLFSRKVKKSVRLLTALVGVLALILALIIFALSFLQNPGNREPIQRISYYMAPAGLLSLLVHLLFFWLPDTLRRRSSPSWRRRDAIYGSGPFQSRDKIVDGGRSVILPPRERRDGGAVLVIVLAVLAAVAAIVLQIQLTARARQQVVNASERHAELTRAASVAVRAAMQRLADDDQLLYDARYDKWAEREEIKTPDGVTTLTTVTDENRYFDLNNLARRTDSLVRPPDEVLRNVLNLSGRFDEGRMVRALQDWTDSDATGSFEKEFYSAHAKSFDCPNRMLLGWNELFSVEGWGTDAFIRRPASSFQGGFTANLRDCLTLLPVKEERVLPVNVNTASRAVLLGVFGIEQDVVVNAVLSMRKLMPVPSVDAIQQLMEPSLYAQVGPYLAVRSDYFRIESRAFIEESSALIRALAHRGADGRVNIVQWMVN